MEESYIEELTILVVVGSLLVTAKIAACCFSLGLHTSHKHINQRQDSLSVAKLNHLESGRISEEKIQLPITYTCSRNPERNTSFQISPKLELPPCSPVLNILQKHLVSVKFQTAD